MRLIAVSIVTLAALAGCSDVTPEPQAAVQGTATLDCDAAVKPQASIGVGVSSDGVKPRANVGLVIDLMQLGKSRDTAADCARGGVKTGANATIGVGVGL